MAIRRGRRRERLTIFYRGVDFLLYIMVFFYGTALLQEFNDRRAFQLPQCPGSGAADERFGVGQATCQRRQRFFTALIAQDN